MNASVSSFALRQRRVAEQARTIARGARACVHLRYRVANLTARPLPEFLAGYAMSRLYRAAGFRFIERGAFISAPLRITGTTSNIYDNLVIADGATISTDVTINLDDRVTIGAGSVISPYVRIYTASHRHGPSGRRCLAEVRPRPVEIGEGVWLGLGALVLPGVVIGRGSVVAAGAVVTRSVPADSFVIGNPAAVVGTLPDTADWMGPRPLRHANGSRVKQGVR